MKGWYVGRREMMTRQSEDANRCLVHTTLQVRFQFYGK